MRSGAQAGSIPARRRTQICAPLVLSSSSTREHNELEPDLAERTEKMRRSLRISHGLSKGSARAVTFEGHRQRETGRSPSEAGRHKRFEAGERTCWREFILVPRWSPLRSGRSSAAGLVARCRTFRWTEQPGGSHSGPTAHLPLLPSRQHERSARDHALATWPRMR